MPRTYLRTLALAALLGFPVAVAAVLFQTAIHDVIHFVWEVVPHWLDWSEPAWWYVILVPAFAGVLVALCLRLPGHGGHSPLEGISTAPIQPIELPGILLAGLATLGLGLVLGPEAPLIALGLGMGVIAVRFVRLEQTEAQLLVLAGAFAAIAALFGGPLAASVMLLELVAMSGAIPAASMVRALLPGFVAAATGALVFTGVGDWRGLHQQDLALPSLPAYDSVRVADLAWGIALSVVIAGVVVGIRHLAHEVAARTKPRPVLALVVAGALVGVIAVAFRAVADRPVDLVLFSGQSEMPDVIAEGSASVLLLLVVAKGLAYALSLGCRLPWRARVPGAGGRCGPGDGGRGRPAGPRHHAGRGDRPRGGNGGRPARAVHRRTAGDAPAGLVGLRRDADCGVRGGHGVARRRGPPQPGGPATRGRGRASRRSQDAADHDHDQ